MEENPETVLKYQKLALEYSKLKAQISVLKAAVSDEHNNSSELQDSLKKKDQLVRKLEQEVECLNFRNVQLTKRISVLQTDLESVDASSKHTKGKPAVNQSVPLSESYNILNAELQSRIEENERLHQQIYSGDFEHEKKVSELESLIQMLQSKLRDQEKEFLEKIAERENAITTLQKEKMKMQVSIKNQEQEMKIQRNSEETKARDVTFVKEDLTLQLEEAKKTIENKVIFNDKRKDTLNLLNVPIIQRSKHEHLSTVMLKLQGFTSDFSRQLSDLHAFMIQRLCNTTSDSSFKAITVKFESYLRENIQHLKALPMCFENVTDAIKTETITWDKSSVVEFSNTFQKYEKNLDKMLPYLILRIQNTDCWTTTSSKLIELIPKLVSLSRKLLACFKKLSRYILLLAVVGTAGKKQYYISQATIVGKILSNTQMLQQLFDDARNLFGIKISLEHQLPMLSQPEKSTDECILAVLVSLSSTLKKVTDLIEKDIHIFSSGSWYQTKNSSSRNISINPSVWQYKERGQKYIEQIGQTEETSIPYQVALKNHQTLCEQADDKENLTQQLEEYQNKLMQLELDKETWMLECQIMRAKETKNPDGTNKESEELNGLDYDEIHRYVKNTVNKLIKQIQFADSKAISFKSECENLFQRLKISMERKEKLEQDLETSRKVINSMKEEQKTLMQSYDEQLNTMSEHLANLNETLTAQRDEIDALKAGNKGNKKGRSK